ncbi:YegP family protein [Flavobacterium sp. LHD-85]|uniref:YegP family protein n=1 Tax=Flavobacterium sp. LHD-85 TaxID=3071410 RepID=UPI0027DF2A29|nr:YegP family protein [Flavobacterium sp. LHD-85]MDQ6530954.1 YegP family protein [Flavobacterium sp. LHD-85]
MGRFIIYKTVNGEFQFTLKNEKNQTLITSTTYLTKANCKKGIERFKIYTQHHNRFHKRINSNWLFYFYLKAPNGHIIGTSSLHESVLSRDQSIDWLKKNTLYIAIRDITSKAA